MVLPPNNGPPSRRRPVVWGQPQCCLRRRHLAAERNVRITAVPRGPAAGCGQRVRAAIHGDRLAQSAVVVCQICSLRCAKIWKKASIEFLWCPMLAYDRWGRVEMAIGYFASVYYAASFIIFSGFCRSRAWLGALPASRAAADSFSIS